MGDPNGPWQHYGDDHQPDDGAPKHLPTPGGAAAGGPGYDLGYGRPLHSEGYGDGYDDGYDDGRYDEGPGPGGVGASLRAAAADAAWRYRSAPLWARVTADVAAASLVLVLIVGVSLALRQDGGTQQAAADGSAPTSTSSTSSSTTVAPTTTTLPPTTTTAPAPTTTTTVPPTTTTAPPAAPPPTEPPTTTTPPPTTTTTQAVTYPDCRAAYFAGALPLYEGEPGYGPHLDRDHDGEACEWDDRGRD